MEVFLWGETTVAEVVSRNGKVRFRGTLRDAEDWLDYRDNLTRYRLAKNRPSLARRLLHSIIGHLRLS